MKTAGTRKPIEAPMTKVQKPTSPSREGKRSESTKEDNVHESPAGGGGGERGGDDDVDANGHVEEVSEFGNNGERKRRRRKRRSPVREKGRGAVADEDRKWVGRREELGQQTEREDESEKGERERSSRRKEGTGKQTERIRWRKRTKGWTERVDQVQTEKEDWVTDGGDGK